MDYGANISPDGSYRYSLWRIWNLPKGICTWIMVNPSTADTTQNDFTTMKCMKFTSGWGYGGLVIVNLFPFRAVNPLELRVVGRDKAIGNDAINRDIITTSLKNSQLAIAAWGKHGQLYKRDQELLPDMIRFNNLHALQLTVDGTPYHPMNVKGNAHPFLWRVKA